MRISFLKRKKLFIQLTRVVKSAKPQQSSSSIDIISDIRMPMEYMYFLVRPNNKRNDAVSIL